MSASLLKSSGVVAVMTLLSRVLGFVRDVMFANVFGAGAAMDAFLIALKIPNFGRRMFAEGAFSQAFVPVFTETRTNGTHEQARELVGVVMGTLSAVLAVITLVGCIAAPLLIWVFAPGFGADPAKHALGAELLRWTFPYLMFISLTALASGVLNSYGEFAVPAFTPVILNLCLIASAFIQEDSVQVLAYAVFVAGVLQFAFQLPSLLRRRLLPWPRWGWRDSRVRRIISLMVPVLIGSSVAQISLLLDSALASFLGDGSVSWLYYADRLMEFPLGIFSIAVGTVILPALSAQHSTQDTGAFSQTLDWALRVILLVGVPAALGLLLFAGPLVATLFGHGEFGDHDTRMTMYALWAYAAGFMGFSLVKVLVPGFYARQETRVPVRYGITALCCGMAMSLTVFTLAKIYDWSAAHAGLAAATSTSAWINALLLLRRLRRDGAYVPQPGWALFALRLLLANAAMAALLLACAGNVEAWLSDGAADRALRVGLTVAAAAVAYFASLLLLGLRPRHFRRGEV
ncbi:MAG TPA: murein biosynthesis integral membrane protein MurJ [Fontimonas sp.]